FSFSSVRRLRLTPMCVAPRWTVSQIDVKPAAVRSRSLPTGGCASTGGSAPVTPAARSAPTTVGFNVSSCPGALFWSRDDVSAMLRLDPFDALGAGVDVEPVCAREPDQRHPGLARDVDGQAGRGADGHHRAE